MDEKLGRSNTTVSERLMRARLPPLSRILMSGEMDTTPPRELRLVEKIDRWTASKGPRVLFLATFVVIHTMVFTFGFLNYHLKDNLDNARTTFGGAYSVARAAALVLHFDIAILLFPICRTLISLLRQTPLNGIIQFDESVSFHKLVAYSILLFTWIHTIAHWKNFAQLAAANNQGFKGFLLANFATGPGWSGYVMLVVLMVIAGNSLERFKRKNHERFWFTHHLFIIFFIFWSVHGAFCMIKTDAAPFCKGTGVFWQYWMSGAVIYLLERVLREIRGRHKTFISKVIQHPSKVMEIQIKKEFTKSKPGQYIFLCCPEISVWQYHPFTLTSAPEEDYISVHIRCVGNFTKALAHAVGCNFEDRIAQEGPAVVSIDDNAPKMDVDPAIRKILPRVYIDGPFGSASEDVFKYEVAVLVGAGIGVTPFASILKSIWYRMNHPRGRGTRLRKVYFFWVCRDYGSFEWFRSLLMAIEAQDMDSNIEIHTYLTARIKPDDATNIMMNDANSEADVITGLRTPTNFGRPNWDAIFRGIRKIHSPAEAGVFFCGPKALGSQLHTRCNMYSGPDFQFAWGKENF
ncbi:MAG: hypothetical protein Q9174_001092 [Haloplaca sp. 1 TL-2023]